MFTYPRSKRVIVLASQDKFKRENDEYPVVIQRNRNPRLWTKDPNLKMIKKEVDSSQQGVNYVVEQYLTLLSQIKMNLTLKVGKTRL